MPKLTLNYSATEKIYKLHCTATESRKVSSHGLFTDDGVPIVLSDVQKGVAESKSNVWTHIISLKREDAERLGYNNAKAWMNLIRSQRNMIAENMKITPENSDGMPHFIMKDTIRTFI